MNPLRMLDNVAANSDALKEALQIRNPRVLRGLVGPATRGYLLRTGKNDRATSVATRNDAHFVWEYDRDHAELAKLYTAAKAGQWDSDRDLDWSTNVDPYDSSRELIPEELLSLADVPAYGALPDRQRAEQRYALLAWMLS